MSNITFLGVGKLGKDCAEVFASKGHYVTGYDINNFDSDCITRKETMKEAIEGAEIIFVALPTPHHEDYDGRYPTSDLEPKDFDYTILNAENQAELYIWILQLLNLPLSEYKKKWNKISDIMPKITKKNKIDMINKIIALCICNPN